MKWSSPSWKKWLKFEFGIFGMRSKVLHQCSSLCGPRVEGTIRSRPQPLDISDLSVAISESNKKIITFVINS